MQACRDGWLWHEQAGDAEGAKRYRRAAEAWESMLLSLDIALDEIGPRHGLAPEAVRLVAECDPFVPIFIEAPQPEHLEAFKAKFAKFLK